MASRGGEGMSAIRMAQLWRRYAGAHRALDREKVRWCADYYFLMETRRWRVLLLILLQPCSNSITTLLYKLQAR